MGGWGAHGGEGRGKGAGKGGARTKYVKNHMFKGPLKLSLSSQGGCIIPLLGCVVLCLACPLAFSLWC